MIPNGRAETYCLAVGTYELGANPLHFDAGDVIVGAPSAIHGTSGLGVIQALTGETELAVYNLDLCCSPWVNTGPSGRAINGNGGKLVNLYAYGIHAHGNGQCGICGIGQGLVIENSELDHNGHAAGDGVSSGVKTVNYAVIRNSYFHDNNGNGMWWDCDAPGGIIENVRSNHNGSSGIFVEISSGDGGSPRPIPAGASYGFIVRNNTADGNNTANVGHNGIRIISSRNVEVYGNIVTNTNGTNGDIRVNNDSRANNGHNGCSSGFNASNVQIHDNQYGPQQIVGCTLTGVSCLNNTKIL